MCQLCNYLKLRGIIDLSGYYEYLFSANFALREYELH